MHVLEIWRYPIKSIGGERLDRAEICNTGILGDRAFGLVDDNTGLVLTARREPRLLFASARLVDGQPISTTDSGRELVTSADYGEWLERPVTLTAAGASGGTYENPTDVVNDADWVSWQGPGEAWHDSARSRVSLVTEATIVGWDPRRFRTNLLLSTDGEDALVGRRIGVGSAVLDVEKRIGRCVMVTRPQPGLDRDLSILRTITGERDNALAIGATVAVSGSISVGDSIDPR